MSQRAEKSPIPKQAELTLAFTSSLLFSDQRRWYSQLNSIYARRQRELLSDHPAIVELGFQSLADVILNFNLFDNIGRKNTLYLISLYVTMGWELHTEAINEAGPVIINCAEKVKHITRGNMSQRRLITTLLQIGANIHNLGERRLEPFEMFLRKKGI